MTEINEKSSHRYVYRYEKGEKYGAGNWLAKAIFNRIHNRKLKNLEVHKDQDAISRQLGAATPGHKDYKKPKDVLRATDHGSDPHGSPALKIEPHFSDERSSETSNERAARLKKASHSKMTVSNLKKTVKVKSNAAKTTPASKTTKANKAQVAPKAVAPKVAPEVIPKTATSKAPTVKPKIRVKAGSSKVEEMNKPFADDIEIISEENIDEAKEVSQVGINPNSYGPKPLEADKNIGFDIWKGNTEREKNIISLIRRNTVKYPDVAGNGDEVYSGARLTRVNFPVAPGQDVKNYNNWFNKGVDPHGLSYEGPFVKEDYDSDTGFYPITQHDLQKNWTAIHTAPIGSKRTARGTTTVIKHPDGSTHHIHGGEIKHDGKGTKDGSGFNVIVHSYDDKTPKGFISNKKSLYGFNKVTNDELNAKEFKTKEHAENHVNITRPMLSQDCNMTIHPKRSNEKIRTERALHKKASTELVSAIKDATSRSANIDNDMKVRMARNKVRKHRNPNLY